MPDERANDELHEYLSGNSSLSRQYRRENSPLPPHALDRMILDASRAAAREPKSFFKSQALAPLAFAASVFLSLAMVLAVVLGPQARKTDDKARVVQVRRVTSEPPRAAIPLPCARNTSSLLAHIYSLRQG